MQNARILLFDVFRYAGKEEFLYRIQTFLPLEDTLKGNDKPLKKTKEPVTLLKIDLLVLRDDL